MFKRIMVATDLSSNAHAAVTAAAELSKVYSAELTIVHVIADVREEYSITPIEARWEPMSMTLDQMQGEVRTEAEEKLKEIVADLKSKGYAARSEILVGVPYSAICHAARDGEHDVVFVGTRRDISGWERVFLGSQTLRLVQKCPSSVWVVKNSQVWPAKAIVVAVDFSEVSKQALRQACDLARKSGATLHAVHVVTHSDTPSNLFARQMTGDWKSRFEQTARDHMKEFLKEVDSTMPIERHIVWGLPWEQIVKTSNEVAADLVVLGTVGHGAIAGLFLGSTAEKVFESCACGVLAVKPSGFVSPLHTSK